MKHEFLQVILELPLDRAPGPDGFTAQFLQCAWDIIKPDIMAVFIAFWYMDAQNFQEVNGTLSVLLLKTLDASAIKDYRPISLVHVIGKLFSKVLANCLALRLGELVHASQSAFIKGRFIQDNFKFVQATPKLLHLKK
jgi:hypothetical protein